MSRLGEYLRACRASLAPKDVGLTNGTGRRVKGLRREEIAVAAGINADYYARLEQGRETNPSVQVLTSLAVALRLDEHGRRHLFELAGRTHPSPGAASSSAVAPEITQLVHAHGGTPAIVLTATLDILEANVVARELYSPFAALDNLAWMTFLDPVAVQFYPDWDRHAHAAVANLRHATAALANHERLTVVLDRLLAGSDEFERRWDSAVVHGKSRAAKHFDHPDVGLLTLTYEAMDLRGSPGQQLLVYQAEPGSVSADRLNLLVSIASERAVARA